MSIHISMGPQHFQVPLGVHIKTLSCTFSNPSMQLGPHIGVNTLDKENSVTQVSSKTSRVVTSLRFAPKK